MKTISLHGWHEATLHHLKRYAVETASEIFQELVERTPVQSGTARGNWNLSLNEPDRTFDTTRAEANGNATVSRGQIPLNHFEWGDKIFMANSTPYIKLLENGMSRQSPGGMIHAVATRLAEELH